MHDYSAIARAILAEYRLRPEGTHGVVHWARVWDNGMRVASETGADAEVVRLFALFHDSRRENEYHDDDHGLRGGELASSLRGTLVHLDPPRFELLYEACRLHTNGHTEGDPTLQACWDGDRLDLGRVGTMPAAHRLCTDAAWSMIPWAYKRSVQDHAPRRILNAWGLDLTDSGEIAPLSAFG